MKIPVSILLLLISTLAIGQSKEEYQLIADSLLVTEKPEDLVTYFDKELLKRPDNEDVLRALGYVHINLNQLDLGEKYYQKALDLNPLCAACHLHLGRVCTYKEDYEEALSHFNKALALDAEDPGFYSHRATIKSLMGNQFNAILDVKKAIALDPDNPEFFIQRANFYAELGSSTSAIKDFTKAIKLAPEDYDTYFKRASFYYEQLDLVNALADMNMAITLDSTLSQFYTARGAVFEMLEDIPKALDDYSKSISLNQEDYLVYLNRAGLNYGLEDLDASCEDLSVLHSMILKGTITDPALINEITTRFNDICIDTIASYYYQRGVGYFNLGEYHKAVKMHDEGLRKFPNHSMMLSFKGNAHLGALQYEEAIQAYELSIKHETNIRSSLKTNPNFINASDEDLTQFHYGVLASSYYSIAECKANLGLFDEALIDVNLAIDIAPDVKEYFIESYYKLRGEIYMNLGLFDNALADFNKSLEMNPNFISAYVQKALAKVSIAEEGGIRTYSIQSSLNPAKIQWSKPSKISLEKSESVILSAISDCDTAIGIQPRTDTELGYAYYIRGELKRMLNRSDACLDILAAKALGVKLTEEQTKNCGE